MKINDDSNSNEKYIDWMSIQVEKNLDRTNYLDYVFICNVWAKDPRYKNRNILLGENRGLFRINKKTLEVTILLPMEGDQNNQSFYKAATKVIQEFNLTNTFPNTAHFAGG